MAILLNNLKKLRTRRVKINFINNTIVLWTFYLFALLVLSPQINGAIGRSWYVGNQLLHSDSPAAAANTADPTTTITEDDVDNATAGTDTTTVYTEESIIPASFNLMDNKLINDGNQYDGQQQFPQEFNQDINYYDDNNIYKISEKNNNNNNNNNNKYNYYKLEYYLLDENNKLKRTNKLLNNFINKSIIRITGNYFLQKNLNNLIIKPTFNEHKCDENRDVLNILYKNKSEIIISLNQFKFNVNSYQEQQQQQQQHQQQQQQHQMETSKELTSIKPITTAAYLCYSDDVSGKLHHMGLRSKFKSIVQRNKRDGDTFKTFQDATPQKSDKIEINGIKIEESDRDPKGDDENVQKLMFGSKATLRLFGTGFSENTIITFTEEKNMYGGSCQLPIGGQFRVRKESLYRDSSVLVEFTVPLTDGHYYLCAKNAEKNISALHMANESNPFIHQGDEPWLRLGSYQNLLPIWASIIICIVCLSFSALFSGLNLGLMSLDRTDLKILCNTGTPKERLYASKIQPVRDHGNYLLCSILLGNVLVNSTFTILLDDLTSGVIAVIFSTLLIVVFGEITPQAICSRHGLAVGARTILITKVVMALTFPLAYPVSKILDFLLGEEIGNVYNRERLKELVRVTNDVNDLDKDEVNIISGALELRKKTVAEAMTHIEDVFMLSYDAILDFETVSEIMKSGFSRVPVYVNERKNVFSMLFIKDLAFVDPDDNTPLRTLCEFYQNPCHFVFEDITLDVMFKQFKEGHKGHMAFVHRVNNEGEGDPFYETIGLITLEDVIEELIQAEIMDETDVYTDNRTKIRRARSNKKQDFSVFAERRENHRIHVSPQLTLATYQYLSTTVDAFKPDIVSPTILRRLLNQDVFNQIKCKGKDRNDPSMVIFLQGKPVDYFVLILEGRVEVTVGKENLLFEAGPFTYFGSQALVQTVGMGESPQQVKGSLQSLNMDALLKHTFVPDYSVKAISDVFYMVIKRTLYLAAKRATLMEVAQKSGEGNINEPLDEEVEKLLHSLDEDDRSITAHTANLNAVTPKASKPSSSTASPIMFMDGVANNGPTNVQRQQGRSSSIPVSYQGLLAEDQNSPLLPPKS